MKKIQLTVFFMVMCLFFTNSVQSQAFTFTNAGASGRQGPTQAQVNSEYANTSLSGQVTSNNGIQQWVVPYSGVFIIEAKGAKGGGNNGGLGASMKGEFNLTQGETLKILVGQKGDSISVPSVRHDYSGGGGSFVTLFDNTPLIVAGGGGGAYIHNTAADGSTGISGQNGGGGHSNANGGSNGMGGSHNNQTSDGGAGLLGNGSSGNPNPAPQSFVNGGEGGCNTWSAGCGAPGGFGGGGSGNRDANTWWACGGGGGYSGGGSAYGMAGNLPYAGGAGSFNSGTNQTNIAGDNAGHGVVIIDPLTFPSMNDAGVTVINNPIDSVFCDIPEDIEVSVRNFGMNQLDSVIVHVAISGDTLAPFYYTGLLDTLNGSGSQTAQLNVGSYAFTQSGFYDIKAWTTMPNGQPDTVNMNDTATKTIFVKLMDLQTSSVTEPLCHGDPTGSISVTSTAVNPTYLWFHGPTGDVVTGLPGGTYTVVVTGDFSCPDTLDVNIHEPDPLTYNMIDGGSVSCNGDTDGFLEIEADGGTPPYTYFWSDGTPGNFISNRAPGFYPVTITDSNNCEAELSIEIIDPAPLAINEDSVVNASCFGYNDATIALNATGGTTPYSWNWNNGDTTGVLADIFGGETYTVTLVDANGCDNDDSYTITQPDQLDTNVVNNHGSFLTANYDFGDATYYWWDCDVEQIVANEKNRDFEPTNNGNYALIISIDGCQDTSNCHTLTRVSAGDLTDEANNFTIYPNPNNGLFNVRLTGSGNDAVQMQIVDMQGKVLTDKKLGRIEGELVEEVNLNLAAGVYFVKVIRDGNLSVKRVVVQ